MIKAKQTRSKKCSGRRFNKKMRNENGDQNNKKTINSEKKKCHRRKMTITGIKTGKGKRAGEGGGGRGSRGGGREILKFM